MTTEQDMGGKDFDADLARVKQIRAAAGNARPDAISNPAFFHTNNDCKFLLAFIDNLWREYSRVSSALTAAEKDAARYRFIRDNCQRSFHVKYSVPIEDKSGDMYEQSAEWGGMEASYMDKFIDTAIEGKPDAT